MIDVCFGSIFSCLTYSNLLRFPFFMKLAHRHLFAVLFSFQRTIALSDLISLSRHFSFVKQIFLFFLCFFRAVYRLTDGGYYPIILFLFCQAGFFRFYRYFRFCSHLPLPTANAATFPVSGDGLRFVFFPFISKQRKRNFYVRHFFIFRFGSLIFFDFSRTKSRICSVSFGYFFSFGP